MKIEKGKYRAIKDASMDLAGAVFLLDEGGEIEVEQIDVNGRKVLVRCGSHIDWMHNSRLHKCFTKIEPQLYTFGESSTEIHDEENSPFKRPNNTINGE